MDPYTFLRTHTHTHTHRDTAHVVNVRALFNRGSIGGCWRDKRKERVRGNPVGLILEWSQNACVFKRMDEIGDAIDKNVRSTSRQNGSRFSMNTELVFAGWLLCHAFLVPPPSHSVPQSTSESVETFSRFQYINYWLLDQHCWRHGASPRRLRASTIRKSQIVWRSKFLHTTRLFDLLWIKKIRW